ncbi:MAG TPA: hypothetical protein HPQ04_06150 [Rhodospirillaceae bacterium]|nr:hypothetical protein [Rhodospirillaceae bacterium]
MPANFRVATIIKPGGIASAIIYVATHKIGVVSALALPSLVDNLSMVFSGYSSHDLPIFGESRMAANAWREKEET